MNLIEQCQQWNEQDEFQKIIDAIEAIPADQRTPELDSELARAYNNWPNLPTGTIFPKIPCLTGNPMKTISRGTIAGISA